MKKLIFLFLLMVPVVIHAQTEEGKYYLYNIISFSGSIDNEGFKVDIDNGIEIKRLRDENGEKIKFKTPAGALMYLASKGWELYINGATSSGISVNGIGSSTTKSYWIMRKPCTKEEFEKAVKESIDD